jgi:hypothetical protein
VRHDRLVVLDDDDRLAGVDEPVEQPEQLLHIGQVQAGGRLVEDVDAALVAHLGGQLEPLALAAGERGERLAEAQVAEAHVGMRSRIVRGRECAPRRRRRSRAPRRPAGRAPRRCSCPPRRYSSTEAWNRLPSHSSQVVATPAIIARSV